MRVLLVGDGAREHAIARQLARSCELYSAMAIKNPGIAQLSQKSFVCPPDSVEPIGAWAIQNQVELAWVTSESALANGLTDALADAGIALASPTMAAAAIGSNTVYAENLIRAAGIPHPEHRVCKDETDMRDAMSALGDIVIKPAIRTETRGAKFTVKDFIGKKETIEYGKSLIKRHGSVIFEKVEEGEVFSVRAFTDGKEVSVMPPVQVATRAMENDEGELTEGMGGYSTGRLLPFMTDSDYGTARQALKAVVSQLSARGIRYKGVISARFQASAKRLLMIDLNSSPGPIETICNLGILRTQLSEIISSIAEERLIPASFDELATVVKYVVPEKFPKSMPRKKTEIAVDEKKIWDSGAQILFESVTREEGEFVMQGGRALALFASGKDVEEAEAKVESAMQGISGRVRHRADIATAGFIHERMARMEKLRGAGR